VASNRRSLNDFPLTSSPLLSVALPCFGQGVSRSLDERARP
jgi:hypothetical protein